MKKYKIAFSFFGVLGVISAIISIVGFIVYFYYGSMDISADASGGGPVGLPYMLAMLAGGAVGIYAAIFAGINAIVVIVLLLIKKLSSMKKQ